METLTWSGPEIRQQFSQCRSLLDIIRQIENRLWTSGQVVCGIKINGMSLSEDDEKRFADSGLGDIEQLEISAQAPASLVRSSLDSQMAMIPELKRASLATSDAFRTHQLPSAQNQLASALEGCRWLTDSLYLVRGLAKDWVGGDFDAATWQRTEAAYTNTLRDILGAYEKKDYNLLADLLEYDLTNALDGWSETLAAVGK